MDTISQLEAALVQVAALTAAAETNQAALVVTTRELGKWKAMYALAVLPVAADDLRRRGNTYRARALALLKQARYWHEIDCQDAESVMHAIRSREAAEARLAAQQGAMETLRGLLDQALNMSFIVHYFDCPCNGIDPDEICNCGHDRWIKECSAALAGTSPVGQAPTGGETETQ